MANSVHGPRVHIDELVWSDYIFYYDGQPFTGFAVDKTERGSLWSEEQYVDGLRCGPSRSWFQDSDQLEEEDYFKFGRLHGMSRAWYRDGRIRQRAEYELGHCLRRLTWDESGQLVEDFTLAPEEEEFELLRRDRADEDAFVARWRAETWRRAGVLFKK